MYMYCCSEFYSGVIVASCTQRLFTYYFDLYVYRDCMLHSL